MTGLEFINQQMVQAQDARYKVYKAIGENNWLWQQYDCMSRKIGTYLYKVLLLFPERYPRINEWLRAELPGATMKNEVL